MCKRTGEKVEVKRLRIEKWTTFTSPLTLPEKGQVLYTFRLFRHSGGELGGALAARAGARTALLPLPRTLQLLCDFFRNTLLLSGVISAVLKYIRRDEVVISLHPALVFIASLSTLLLIDPW